MANLLRLSTCERNETQNEINCELWELYLWKFKTKCQYKLAETQGDIAETSFTFIWPNGK